MPTPKKIKKLKPPSKALAIIPKLKKDGTPFTPWAEEVALRLENKAKRIAANGGVEDRTRKCTAHTSGVHGPKRLCDKYAVHGLKVCATHGGSTKLAKEAARKRLVDELDPTISRLIAIRDQDDHLPSALGAATHIMNRVMGKPDAVDKEKGAGRAIINVGIAIGGIPASRATVRVSEETIDAEPTDVDDDDTRD